MLLELLKSPDQLVFFVVALIIAITVHEFAHAWMATRLGDPTARAAGRLTLNPLAHLDPMGTILILLTKFGWGKPVPYNPNFLRNRRWGELWVALAGPFTNLLTAFVFALPLRIYLIQKSPWPPDGQIWSFLSIVVGLNVILAGFNLIPIPPLDGSKILRAILGEFGAGSRIIIWLEQMGPMLLLVLIFADRFFNTRILWTLLTPVFALIEFLVGSPGLG